MHIERTKADHVRLCAVKQAQSPLLQCCCAWLSCSATRTGKHPKSIPHKIPAPKKSSRDKLANIRTNAEMLEAQNNIVINNKINERDCNKPERNSCRFVLLLLTGKYKIPIKCEFNCQANNVCQLLGPP